jgi:hypothetical protein
MEGRQEAKATRYIYKWVISLKMSIKGLRSIRLIDQGPNSNARDEVELDEDALPFCLLAPAPHAGLTRVKLIGETINTYVRIRRGPIHDRSTAIKESLIR